MEEKAEQLKRASGETFPAKNKEEGELSSSFDDDERPRHKSSRLDGRSSRQSATALVRRNLQHAAKSVSTNNREEFVGQASRSYVQPNHRNKFEKKRVPLVISFSDDDSGSDSESEDYKRKNASEAGNDTFGVARSRRPPAASSSKMLPGNTKKEAILPRKVSPSRTSISSMMKTGRLLSKSGGHVNNIISNNKNKAEQEHGRNQNVHLNSSKLQDLRQLIAIRENELKIKVDKKKESPSGSCKNNSAPNLSSGSTKICREAHDDFGEDEVKEPERKRLKFEESHACPVNTECRKNVQYTESTLLSENIVLEKCGQQLIDNHRSSYEQFAVGTSQPQRAEKNCRSALAGDASNIVKNGTSSITGVSHCNHTAQLEGRIIAVNRPVDTSDRAPHTADLGHPVGTNYQPPFIPVNKTTNEFRSAEKAIEPVLKDAHQVCPDHILSNNLETFDASRSNSNIWNTLGNLNISGTTKMDLQELMELEELHDKELEEAQEYRHKCEVEERVAHKAYRRAQRATMEANSRCAHLYRNRELFSAQLRSLMMDNPSMLWSSSLGDEQGEGPNSLNKAPDVNLHVVPLGHRAESELYAHNHGENVSVVGFANVTQKNVSGIEENVQHLSGTSTSEPKENNADMNAADSQSSDSNLSAEEGDEAFLIENEMKDSNLGHQRKEVISGEDRKLLDSSQDSLLLEASLRSQLFARLGVNSSLNKRGVGQKPKDETESSAHDGNDDSLERSTGILLSSDLEKDLSFDLRGNEIEGTLSELPVQIKANCYVDKFSSNFGSSIDVPLDNKFVIEALYPVMRSAFVHMKVVDVVNLVHSHNGHNSTGLHSNDKNSRDDSHYETVGSSSTPREETSVDICFKEAGFYSCNPNIDPLWPLCMFELRGKCNNDECPWQHVRDNSCRNLNIDNAIEGEVLETAPGMMSPDATKFSKSSDLLGFAPPSYLVCSDIMKADLSACKSVLGQSEASCWQTNFSATLVLSSLLPMGLPLDQPFLHGPGARIESYGSWNRQSSYFHSIQGMSQPNHHLIDIDESLDMALVILGQEANKQKGRIEALKLLARALEADPKSAVLWIVYLHIYYCNQKSIGKDDMFKYAVEHNRGSYELWLMYINSREQLEDRLIAYETSLSALSHNASPDKDAVHSSKCILDIFLQMMNTLCISGKVGKALEKLNELFPSRMNSCEPYGLSDVVACLTVWDKCIFWVCCVYLILYKKLPDTLVPQFECQKELSALEWVSTQLTSDEKQQAVRLLEMAVNSLELDIDCESHGSETETARKAGQVFAINHVRCVAVLQGSDCSRILLDRYIKLYPSCVELALVAARAHEVESEDTSFDGFERALSNWLEDVPGVQCIWNQYVEYALQSGRESYVQTLMDRWFHSVWKVKCSQHKIFDTLDGEMSPGSQNPDAYVSNSRDFDLSFGLLNFSIYKLLQNDRTAAHSAIDRALECASAENFKHCVKEHAMFWLTGGSQLKDTPASEMLNILKDISLVNLVLQVCNGPLLLPQAFDKLSDLVDLVESVMEILPANYQLAISVCKFLSRSSNSAVVTSSVSYWASSVLVNALFKTVPVAPEYVWVEAVNVLHDLDNIHPLSLSFHKRALAVYPFSLKLWNSYLSLCKITGDEKAVKSEAARRGIELD
ncbi:RNA-binding family protein [Heracleum sosnowskyi]|uniref:RNA-binding family protein n=1 Tax=Heracleum sosnowskyi TaxID=360622 RepID=A0AAD8MLT8_9APIA|nr:RNA-binding family protein [Heracleum sosnowskyi]